MSNWLEIVLTAFLMLLGVGVMFLFLYLIGYFEKIT